MPNGAKSMRFKLVRAADFVPQAEQILAEAWPNSGLRHTADYLAWQFGFPGASKYPAAVAFDGIEPVGFAGATSRQARYFGTCIPLALVSFVSVRPAWQCQGVASGLYDLLLGALRLEKPTILTFALADSTGERTLLRAYESAGFRVQALGTYRSHACVVRPSQMPRGWVAASATDSEFSLALDQLLYRDQMNRTLWAHWAGAQLTHYRSDPRPREAIVVRNGEGEVKGAAWVVCSQWTTPQGTTWGLTLDSIAIADDDPDALAALVQHATTCRRSGPPSDSPLIVMAPNLCEISQETIRRAGLRQSPTVYRGFVCGTDTHAPMAQAHLTNIEIT